MMQLPRVCKKGAKNKSGRLVEKLQQQMSSENRGEMQQEGVENPSVNV